MRLLVCILIVCGCLLRTLPVAANSDGWVPLQIPLSSPSESSAKVPSSNKPKTAKVAPAPAPQKDDQGWAPLALVPQSAPSATPVRKPKKTTVSAATDATDEEWQSMTVPLDVDRETLQKMLLELRAQARSNGIELGDMENPSPEDLDQLLKMIMAPEPKKSSGKKSTNKAPVTNASVVVPGKKPADPDDFYSLQVLDPRLLQPQGLTAKEMEYARTAWNYFSDAPHPKTGLAPSVKKFKSMTLWDQGGYILAICSAYKLGIIPEKEARKRLARVFASLAKMPLYKDRLPNKAYNIETLTMTDYANRPKPKGVGYSALDIMRLMSGVLVATQIFPDLTKKAEAFTKKWDLKSLAKNGRFHGVAIIRKRAKRHVQEGRIGYEQYAGVTGRLLGLPVETAHAYAPILRWQQYHDLRLPADNRTKDTHGVSAVTTSEPFLLEVLEYGWRPEVFPVAWAVFRGQLLRHKRTGQLTALSEDHIKGPPYFAYNGILVDNEPFKSVTASRKDVSDKRGLSTKASFGWWALTRHPYTYELLKAVDGLQTENGWFAGLFEKDMSANKILTLNTNAVILEALHYKAFGPLYKM